MIKNNGIDNVNSLNIVNKYCVNNFYENFQIDVCNNSSGHETRGNIYDSQKDEWLQNQYKQ